ncbi:PTS system, galactosamine-specific IIA component [Agrilactobacillus composti DSM 18527 = JCM 14202]|nr:PTS sugar transporter subunit IIA [Agrilactobacillus composti]GAF38698.1 PTS system, galactosamine-specific IIA component [Agrilactobacillus composti DSM 18527 = JCM 14202]
MSRKIYFISHNNFAQGLKQAVEMIAGKQDNVTAFGLMPGGDPNAIIKTIEADITDADEVLILGDLEGGSVCNAAMRLTIKDNVTLVTGSNLTLALQVVLDSDPTHLDHQIEQARTG